MPTPFIKKVAEDQGKPVAEIEDLWSKAKAAAAKEGKAEDYAYITGIFKRMAGVTSSAKQPALTFATKAAERLTVTANSEVVRDLAQRVFGQDIVFEPNQSVMIVSGEPVMWVIPDKPYTLRELMYFSRAMDKNTRKFRVNYVMPDQDKGKNAMRVSFFRGMRPTR